MEREKIKFTDIFREDCLIDEEIVDTEFNIIYLPTEDKTSFNSIINNNFVVVDLLSTGFDREFGSEFFQLVVKRVADNKLFAITIESTVEETFFQKDEMIEVVSRIIETIEIIYE